MTTRWRGTSLVTISGERRRDWVISPILLAHLSICSSSDMSNGDRGRHPPPTIALNPIATMPVFGALPCSHLWMPPGHLLSLPEMGYTMNQPPLKRRKLCPLTLKILPPSSLVRSGSGIALAGETVLDTSSDASWTFDSISWEFMPNTATAINADKNFTPRSRSTPIGHPSRPVDFRPFRGDGCLRAKKRLLEIDREEPPRINGSHFGI